MRVLSSKKEKSVLGIIVMIIWILEGIEAILVKNYTLEANGFPKALIW